MDKKSGFKECPRCGLRNKPTAKQCDFCGQKFEIADDWEQQIDALEKLSKSSSKVEISEDMSKKFEAARVTKDMVETKDREEASKPVKVVVRPEPAKVEFIPTVQPEPEPVRQEPVVEVPLAPPAPKPVPVAAPKPEPIPVAPMPAPAPVIEAPQIPVKQPEPVKAQPAPMEAIAEPEPEEAEPKVRKAKSKPLPSTKFFRWGVNAKDRMSLVFAGLLTLGVIAYIVSISMVGSLGTVISWGFVVVSSMLIVMGFSQVGINWQIEEDPMHVDIPGTADDEVVEICPSCHERVSPDCDRCPACGTEFEPSEEH